MFQVVESIRLELCRLTGFLPETTLYFYRDHIDRFGCGCEFYYQLLDACPVRIPVGKDAGTS